MFKTQVSLLYFNFFRGRTFCKVSLRLRRCFKSCHAKENYRSRILLLLLFILICLVQKSLLTIKQNCFDFPSSFYFRNKVLDTRVCEISLACTALERINTFIRRKKHHTRAYIRSCDCRLAPPPFGENEKLPTEITQERKGVARRRGWRKSRSSRESTYTRVMHEVGLACTVSRVSPALGTVEYIRA